MEHKVNDKDKKTEEHKQPSPGRSTIRQLSGRLVVYGWALAIRALAVGTRRPVRPSLNAGALCGRAFGCCAAAVVGVLANVKPLGFL